MEEYKQVARVVLVGMLIVGSIGFVILVTHQLMLR